MPTWITIERVLLVLLIAVVGWQAEQSRADRRLLDKIGETVLAMEGTVKENTTAVVALRSAPPPEAVPCIPAGPGGAGGGLGGGERGGRAARGEGGAGGPQGVTVDPAAAGGPRAARAKRMAAMPGNVLARMYDAADRMAEDEGWDDATYDQVTGVFEESAGRAATLFEELQAGTLQPVDARDQAVALRDEVTTKLVGVLGPEGVARLKGYVGRAEAAAPR